MRRASQPTLDIPHVRVRATVASPVHGLQRLALYAALACAQFRERVPAARVICIRELVHAIAGLQVRWRSTQHTRAPNTACKRQWIRLPASAPPHPATAHGRRQQATIPAKGGLPQPARTLQSPSPFAQKVTMHLLGSSDRTHIHTYGRIIIIMHASRERKLSPTVTTPRPSQDLTTHPRRDLPETYRSA